MELGYLLKSSHRNAKIGFTAVICFLITQFIFGIPFYLGFTFYSKPINIVELIDMQIFYFFLLIPFMAIMFGIGILSTKYLLDSIPKIVTKKLNTRNIINFFSSYYYS